MAPEDKADRQVMSPGPLRQSVGLFGSAATIFVPVWLAAEVLPDHPLMTNDLTVAELIALAAIILAGVSAGVSVRLRRAPLQWVAPGIILLAFVLWVAVVVFPPLLVTEVTADRAKAVNDARTTLLGILGGVAVVAGTIVAALTLRTNRLALSETQKQHAAEQQQHREELELQRRGQLTERFARAIEQLGSDELDIQVGAIYLLEQIAHDSAPPVNNPGEASDGIGLPSNQGNDLHWPIVEILTAYLRKRHPATNLSTAHREGVEEEDVQAIVTVLGRRDTSRDPSGESMNLRSVDLRDVHLPRTARLGSAIFDKANLERASLRGAVLTNAHLVECILLRADLTDANLEGANLAKAQMADPRIGKFCDTLGLTRSQLDSAQNVDTAILPEYAQLIRT